MPAHNNKAVQKESCLHILPTHPPIWQQHHCWAAAARRLQAHGRCCTQSAVRLHSYFKSTTLLYTAALEPVHHP
jgi:hypothetical protein